MTVFATPPNHNLLGCDVEDLSENQVYATDTLLDLGITVDQAVELVAEATRLAEISVDIVVADVPNPFFIPIEEREDEIGDAVNALLELGVTVDQAASLVERAMELAEAENVYEEAPESYRGEYDEGYHEEEGY